MNDLIIYPNEVGGIVVLIPNPSSPLSIQEIAERDTPTGRPFLILNRSEFPTSLTFRDAWEADFSSPDGYGA